MLLKHSSSSAFLLFCPNDSTYSAVTLRSVSYKKILTIHIVVLYCHILAGGSKRLKTGNPMVFIISVPSMPTKRCFKPETSIFCFSSSTCLSLGGWVLNLSSKTTFFSLPFLSRGTSLRTPLSSWVMGVL